jgi:AraC-like DNA-binding protein
VRVLEYIEARLSDRLDLRVLSKEVGISPFHFAALFRKAVGATPHGHVQHLRMEAAKAMLRDTDNSTLQIAYPADSEAHLILPPPSVGNSRKALQNTDPLTTASALFFINSTARRWLVMRHCVRKPVAVAEPRASRTVSEIQEVV